VPLQPCAYLHNYDGRRVLTRPVLRVCIVEQRARVPEGRRGARPAAGFIRQHVRTGDKGELIYRIEQGRIRPPRGWWMPEGMLKGKREFVLVDDQKSSSRRRSHARRRRAGQKQVVIVEGGPGTGKSVVAVNLLVALTSGGWSRST
jgi:uncharacterized protein